MLRCAGVGVGRMRQRTKGLTNAMKMKKKDEKERTNACVEEQGKGMRRRETRCPWGKDKI